MRIEDCFELGYIEKAKGLNGELVAFFDADEPERYAQLDAIFVNENQQLVPYIIDSIKPFQDKFVLKLEEIDHVDIANSLKGCKLYLPLEVLPNLGGTQYYLHELPGFTVVDKNEGELGEVKSVIEANQNLLLLILHKGKEVLVPLQDDIVTQVDKAQETIHTALPDGLLAIYLDA